MAPHSSTLAWKIPWTEEPGRLRVAFLYSGSLWSSLYCGVSLLWEWLDGWLVKVSCLGKLVSVFWWVELGFFSLECSEVSSNEL